ncbi:hypothetical protein [Lactiplantibacillus mudanjiangensis]|uniref:Uncharacterized protein n=1 Tax=Lactiplantibacillus mudanjiangensis TaxID=1296538 RepID=A0A660DW15_9LACO|nr:hypothetical protein [Lactiplantibacillus mudanjiangensis]VDG23688.1 hypothetical protein [Lactobacillus brevis] [Lactiplantibacillus mudanjiangensis]VDG27831.1 hypothetical protein [Lactobacillus brevis] [Lactiplantibacillus mudanjiangensis]
MIKAKLVKMIALLSSLLIILAACGTSDIKNGKVATKSYSIVRTNVDHENVFTMIPVVISTGKSTSVIYTPMYDNIDHLKVWYEDKGKVKLLKTDNFDFVKTKRTSYVKIAANDAGKSDIPCVVYKSEAKHD